MSDEIQRWAVVEGGIGGTVTNIAEATAEVAAERDGWVPAGSAKIGDTWEGGDVFSVPPVPPPDMSQFEAALYTHFNQVAQDEGKDQGRPGWENRHTLLGRAGYLNTFQEMALSYGAWVDVCELQALQLLADVQAGNAPPPASIEAFLATLPAWVKP